MNTEEIVLFFICLVKLVCAVHIIMNKHNQPVSAVLWLAYLVIFPHGLGVPFYLVFGINRIQQKMPKIQSTTEKVKDLHSVESGTIFSYLKAISKQRHSASLDRVYSRMFDKMFPETPLISGNHVDLLHDGTEAYPAMMNAIVNAEKHIHLCSYIIVYDHKGKEIIDALVKKAEEGVKVKIIYDSIGSYPFTNAVKLQRLDKKHPNIEVKPYAVFDILAPYRFHLRNHRKLLVIDGKVAFVGGINISEANVNHKKQRAIHDLHCKIEGPVLGYFQYMFLRDWCHVAKESPERLFNHVGLFVPPEKKENDALRVVGSGPGQSHEATRKVFLTAANSARKSLWIMTPYFVPDQAMLSALKIAAVRNVDVRIIVPEKSDHWFVQNASRSFYGTLLEDGVRVFERVGRFNHSKAMLVDNEWSFMGSSNCDGRSFSLNYELDFICEQGAFIADVHNQFLRELSKSKEISLSAYNKRGVCREFKENLASLFTPVL